jgi:hypothetical protein
LATLPSPSLLCSLLLAPLNVIARDFLILFHVCIWSHQPYSFTFISFIHLPPPSSTLHGHFIEMGSRHMLSFVTALFI